MMIRIKFAALALLVAVASLPAETLEPGPKVEQPEIGPHEGIIRSFGDIQTETLVRPSGIRVYFYTAGGQPIDMHGGRGVAIVSVEGEPKRYRYALMPVGDQSLATNMDLSRLAGKQVVVDFQFAGVDAIESGRLAYRNLSSVTTERPLASATMLAETVAAGTEEVKPHVYKVTKDDAQFIAAQKICPVMEESLLAMGGPLKVDAGGKAIYICCAGCAKLILANPDKYVAYLSERGVDAPVIR